MLGDVRVGIFVDRIDTGHVLGLELGEPDGDFVSKRQVGLLPEIRKAFPLFLAHVIAVCCIGGGNGLEPTRASYLFTGYRGHGVSDLVVILDRIFGLVCGAVLITRAFTDAEKVRVEKFLFRESVHFEKRGESSPNGGERPDVAPFDLFENREKPALLVMVVQYQLSNIHVFPSYESEVPR